MFRFFRRNKATIAEILTLHNSGLIGTIESRNWLAFTFPDFEKSRRDDVDKALEDLGSEMATRNDFFDPDIEEEEQFT